MAKIGEDWRDMDRDLKKLLDCDLDDWDYDFVNTLTDRLGKYGADTYMSKAQTEQFERIKEEYL